MKQWREIEGFDGKYLVSNEGEVFSRASGKTIAQRIDSYGYPKVNLALGSKKRTANVHRLVAEAFLPNENDLPQVNHIDENKLNNTVGNLEWCDIEHNLKHGTRIERLTDNACCKWGKPVVKMQGDRVVARYRSVGEAARENGLKATRISRCCNSERGTYKGYAWRFAS